MERVRSTYTNGESGHWAVPIPMVRVGSAYADGESKQYLQYIEGESGQCLYRWW